MKSREYIIRGSKNSKEDTLIWFYVQMDTGA